MKLKVHMGCGVRNFGKDWIHIDGGDYAHLDHNNIFDFPYFDIDLIYASHVLEYFDLNEVKELLKIWYSKLKKGGVLRIAVPDFRAMARLYLNENYSLKSFIGPLYGKMTMGQTTIYHKFVYDDKLLSEVFSNIGFKNIRSWDHKKVDHGVYDDHSQAYLPHMDKTKGTLISLNMECDK